MPHLLRDWMMHRFRSGGAYDWDARSGVLPAGFALTRSGTALGWRNGAYASFATNVERIEDLDYVGLPGRKGLLIEGARTNVFPGGTQTFINLGSAAPIATPAEGGSEYEFTLGDVLTSLGLGTGSAATLVSGFFKLISNTGNRLLDVLPTYGDEAQGLQDQALSATFARLATAQHVSSGTAGFLLRSNNGTGNLTFRAKHLQVEAAAFPSSPIPTSGAAATRNAETCSRAVVLPAGGFTAIIEFTVAAAPDTAANQSIYALHNQTSAERFNLRRNTAGGLDLVVVSGGSSLVAPAIFTLGTGVRHRIAMRVKAGSYAISLNGSAPYTSSFANYPAATTEQLGGNHAAAEQPFAHILKSNASPTRWRAPATDAQLQQLSTLDDLDWDARMGVLPPGFALTRSGTAQGWRAGAYASFATNVERIEDLDYIGLPGRKGLLIEGARTNLLLRSAEYSNASWTKANATATADQGTAPDGTSAADLIFPSTGSSDCHVTQSVNQSAAVTQYTYSFYAKAAGKPSIWVFVFDQSFGGGPAQYFDVSTGALGTGGQGSGFTRDNSSIQSIGNGWYRCSVTFTTPVTTTTVFCQVNVTDALNSLPVTVSGTNGVLFWGAQLELGAFRTSQVPTAGATATRNAETCSRSVVLPVAGFTLRWEFIAPPIAGATQIVAQLKDPGSINEVDLYINSSGALLYGVYVSGVQVVSKTLAGSLIPGSRYSVAARVQNNNHHAAINGVLSGSAVVDAMPSNLTVEAIGCRTSSLDYLFSHILRCNYSPTIWRAPATDATLQALSTLT